MRQMFVESDDHQFDPNTEPAKGLFIDADGDRFDEMPKQVTHDAPWAEVAVEVEGGYQAFESYSDYETWSKQV